MKEGETPREFFKRQLDFIERQKPIDIKNFLPLEIKAKP